MNAYTFECCLAIYTQRCIGSFVMLHHSWIMSDAVDEEILFLFQLATRDRPHISHAKLVSIEMSTIKFMNFFCISTYLTVCNRTYYARLGSTYRLSLVRPRMSGTTQILPWHCWFNFTALGGHHGDRVLVSKTCSYIFVLFEHCNLEGTLWFNERPFQLYVKTWLLGIHDRPIKLRDYKHLNQSYTCKTSYK